MVFLKISKLLILAKKSGVYNKIIFNKLDSCVGLSGDNNLLFGRSKCTATNGLKYPSVLSYGKK